MVKVAFFYSNNDKRVGHPDIKHLQEEERREKGQPEGLYWLLYLVVSQPQEATVIDINSLFKEHY